MLFKNHFAGGFLMKKQVAEFIGTFTLVLFGCGAAVIAGMGTGPTSIDVLGIAFAFGLAIVAMAYGIGPVSGCHVNPAVSFGVHAAPAACRWANSFRMPSRKFSAPLPGAAVLYLILSGKASGWSGGLGQNGWGTGYLGQYNMTSGVRLRGRRDVPVPRLHSRRDAAEQPDPYPRARRPRHRPDAGRDPHCRHQRHRRVGEPGAARSGPRSSAPAPIPARSARLWLFIVAPLIGAGVAGILFKADGILSADKT